MFDPHWELKYFFQLNNFNEPQCMVCYRKIAVIRKYNISRHYTLCHNEYEKYIGEERDKLFSDLKEAFRINERAGITDIVRERKADEVSSLIYEAKKLSKAIADAELKLDEGSHAVRKKNRDTFQELFGDRFVYETKNPSLGTTADSCQMNTFEVTWSSDTEEDIKPNIEELQITVLPTTTDTLQTNNVSKVPSPATNATTTTSPANILKSRESPKIRKNISPATEPIIASTANGSQSTLRLPAHRDNFAFEREKLKVNKKIEKRKLRLEERKLCLEERKFDVALEWQKKIFELRKMELESKEKIAKLELELKYKNSDS